jgi:uncharacterized protein YndB with AHSA1/START domain
MNHKNETKIIADPDKHDITITREFDAPRELVFKAFTDPKLFAQFMGPRNLKTDIKKFEAKPGGEWRYVQTEPNGKEHWFHGVFHEVFAPERIIQTFEYDNLPEKGHAALDTEIFESLPDDRTKTTIHSVFQSVADRDGMIQSGMERGVIESHERLDEVLEKQMSHVES